MGKTGRGGAKDFVVAKEQEESVLGPGPGGDWSKLGGADQFSSNFGSTRRGEVGDWERICSLGGRDLLCGERLARERERQTPGKID